MNKRPCVNYRLIYFFIAASLVACGTTSTRTASYLASGKHGLPTDISGLTEDTSQSPTELYLRRGTLALGNYKRYIIEPMLVDYRDRAIEELAPADIHRIQQYFLKRMGRVMRDGGYTVGTRSARRTVRVSFTLLGLKAAAATTDIADAAPPLALDASEVTVEVIFRNALTHRIDAVIIYRAPDNQIMKATLWSSWRDIEAALDDWAAGIRHSVDKARAVRLDGAGPFDYGG